MPTCFNKRSGELVGIIFEFLNNVIEVGVELTKQLVDFLDNEMNNGFELWNIITVERIQPNEREK